VFLIKFIVLSIVSSVLARDWLRRTFSKNDPFCRMERKINELWNHRNLL